GPARNAAGGGPRPVAAMVEGAFGDDDGDGAENATKFTGGNRPRDRRHSVVCALVPGVQRIEDLARGKKLATSCEAFSAPGARAVRGHGPKSRSQERKLTTPPYPDRPLLPLAVGCRGCWKRSKPSCQRLNRLGSTGCAMSAPKTSG